jgi:hypothetical protein
VIIGGLLSSTVVARIVTPAIYKLIPPTIEVQTQGRPREGGDPSPELDSRVRGNDGIPV